VPRDRSLSKFVRNLWRAALPAESVASRTPGFGTSRVRHVPARPGFGTSRVRHVPGSARPGFGTRPLGTAAGHTAALGGA